MYHFLNKKYDCRVAWLAQSAHKLPFLFSCINTWFIDVRKIQREKTHIQPYECG